MVATEYCEKVFDGTHDTPKPVKKGRLLITSKHIANQKLDISSAYYISEEDFENINKRSQVHQWDILFSMIGTVGNVYIETSKEIDYAIKNMGVFSCGNKDKAYWLYYYLQTPFVKAKIEALMAGAVQKFVPLGFLRNLDVPKYSEKANRIVSVLSSLDDKIALNKCISAKLEKMAKRLYDYWFVQYDFPDKNGHPYKTTGGPMTYNPTLKREIPAGWEVKNVNDVTTSVRGVSYSSDDEKSKTDSNVVQILRGNNISGSRFVFDGNDVFVSSVLVAEEQKISKFDIVMTMSSGSKEHVGKSALALYDMPHSFGAFCSKFTPNEEARYFIDCYLHSEIFIKYIRQTCSGTGINNLTNGHFDKSLFAWPTEDILKSFNEKFSAIYEQRGVIEREITRLTALRDKFLPLLMNGQVEVG